MKFFQKKEQDEESGVPKPVSYVVPGILVTTLFFLWGFSYGLLDTLNKHFRNVLGISTTQTTYMQVAYFGAYLVMSIPASMLSKRLGYKRTILVGLMLYVLGALCFYPSATYLSFGGFVGSLFVIASGIAILENCANTYITIIGPRKTAGFRINTAQAFNGLASVVAPIVASYAFFGGENDSSSGEGSLDSVKWTYVGVGCGVFCVAVLFTFANIPEVDEDAIIAAEAEATGEVARRATLYSPHLILGALTQFIYTGAQIAVASMFIFYGDEVGKKSDSYASIMLSVALAVFAVGRLTGGFLMKRFRPDYLLAIYSLADVIILVFVVAMKTPPTFYALIIFYYFESIQFPTIFALGTRDLGKNHKRGSAFIIMGVSGGALIPPLQAVVHDHVNVNISFVIPLACFCCVFLYAVFGSRWIIYAKEDLALDETDSVASEKHVDYQENAKQQVSL